MDRLCSNECQNYDNFKEVIITLFQVLSQHLFRGNEKNFSQISLKAEILTWTP